MRTQVAKYEITSGGGFGGITSLLGSLQGMAEQGSTAAQQLWAVNAAFTAITEILPDAISMFGAMQHAADWLSAGLWTAQQLAPAPASVTGAVTTAAAPFLTAMQG